MMTNFELRAAIEETSLHIHFLRRNTCPAKETEALRPHLAHLETLLRVEAARAEAGQPS